MQDKLPSLSWFPARNFNLRCGFQPVLVSGPQLQSPLRLPACPGFRPETPISAAASSPSWFPARDSNLCCGFQPVLVSGPRLLSAIRHSACPGFGLSTSISHTASSLFQFPALEFSIARESQNAGKSALSTAIVEEHKPARRQFAIYASRTGEYLKAAGSKG